MKDYLFSFEGRIGRKEYWLFVGPLFLAYILIFIIFGETSGMDLILTVLVLWPSLAIQAKRWHDRDKSAWWILINFVPVVGPLWALVENGILPGHDEPNTYGGRLA